MTQVQLPTAASSFSPSPLSVQSHKSVCTALCAIACTNAGPHIKNPDSSSYTTVWTQKNTIAWTHRNTTEHTEYLCLDTKYHCLNIHKPHCLNTPNTIVWTHQIPLFGHKIPLFGHTQIPLFGHTKYHCLNTPNTIVWTPNTTVWTQKYHCLNMPNTIS